MEELDTSVKLSLGEMQALLHLGWLASGRMSVAEELYYDALLARLAQELAKQTEPPIET